MVFKELGSEFRVVSAGEASAGRGLTIQNLHCSEVSRWPGDASATLAGLRAALSPGGEMTLESTPWGAYGCFYEEWMRESDAVRHFFPWWMAPAYAGRAAEGELTTEEAALVATEGLTREQIGFRRGLEQSFRGLRAQEFAEDAQSCFRATGECCFEVEAIEESVWGGLCDRRSSDQARRGALLRSGCLRLPGKEYLVAVDTAGGGSGWGLCGRCR